MSMQNVQAALTKAFRDPTFFADDKVAFENFEFDPPKDAAWARLFFVPGQPTPAELGATGNDRVDGFLQIDLNFPLNSGTKDVGDKYDAIRNVFKAGTNFAYSGQSVTIKSCGRSQGRIVHGCYRISVTVMFYAFLTR